VSNRHTLTFTAAAEHIDVMGPHDTGHINNAV